MSNVVGKELVVEVPVSAFKAIGNFDKDTKYFQKFLSKIFARSVDSLTEKQKQEFENLKPYWVNTLLISIPVSIMIEENITFETAIKAASQQMKDTCYHLDLQFTLADSMCEFMPFANQMLEEVADEILSPAFKISSSITSSEENSDSRCSVTIKEVSQKLSDVLEDLGILTLAEKLSTVESLTDTLQTSVLNPISETLTKCCKEKFEDFETNLSAREEFNEMINEMLEELKDQFFIKSVLSILLTKAISDNITLAEAVLAYDEATLLDLAAKELTKVEALKSCAAEYEKMIYGIYELS